MTEVLTSKVIYDMDDYGPNSEMKRDAFTVASAALEQFSEDSAMSKHIKTFFDNKVKNIIYSISIELSDKYDYC
jgi:hypothetical protein